MLPFQKKKKKKKLRLQGFGWGESMVNIEFLHHS